MKLKEMLKLNADCMAVRWIEESETGKYIDNLDIWKNDDINEIFTKEQLNKEVDYITSVDDELIVMLKEETK